MSHSILSLMCSVHFQPESEVKLSRRRSKRMERLRRSFRESFRRKKDHVPESSKPHQWQSDELSVRSGTCYFHVKVISYHLNLCSTLFNARLFRKQYLGCVEVYESRGMQVCEEALKVLRVSFSLRALKTLMFINDESQHSRRRPVKGVLHISGDGLRVVEDDTKVLGDV